MTLSDGRNSQQGIKSKTKVRTERINSLTEVSHLVNDKMGTRMPPSLQGTAFSRTPPSAVETFYNPMHLLTWPSKVLETSIQRYLFSWFLFTAEVAKQAFPSFVTGRLLTVDNGRSPLLPATRLNATWSKPLMEVLMNGLNNCFYWVVYPLFELEAQDREPWAPGHSRSQADGFLHSFCTHCCRSSDIDHLFCPTCHWLIKNAKVNNTNSNVSSINTKHLSLSETGQLH